jgi:hypothetical protein
VFAASAVEVQDEPDSQGDWKPVASGTSRPLFELASDPNEENDLASKHPEKLTAPSACPRAEQQKEQGARLTQPKP